MKTDFSGYVTRYDVKCSDGVTIKPGAFRELDGVTVPLLWRHSQDDPGNVLGQIRLEHREDGVYGYGKLNNTENGQLTKELIRAGDINKFSIWANRLVKRGQDVLHGAIREVSLVISGANEGAFIDYVSIQHGESNDLEFVEAVIHYSGGIDSVSAEEVQEEEVFHEEDVVHEDDPRMKLQLEQNDTGRETDDDDEDDADELEQEEIKHKDTKEEDMTTTGSPTVQDILNTLNADQKKAVDYVFTQLLEDNEQEDSVKHDESEVEEIKHDNTDGGSNLMTRNVFDQNEKSQNNDQVLSHDELQTIVKEAKRVGSLKEAFLEHAATYGIEDIDILFPDAKLTSATPEMIKRDTSWVGDVMKNVRKSPMARIKTVVGDITAAEARARGYTKGGLKVEEVFGLLARTTSPTTVYKKQKLDRDDIIDITDLDVVVWLKAEMRLMLEEEVARAILLGDGRGALHDDKIKDPEGQVDGIGIRSILNENVLYAETVTIAGVDEDPELVVEAVVRSRKRWRGSGVPTFYTTVDVVADLLLKKDNMGRRIYETEAQLSGALRADRIVEVEVMEEHEDLIGILVNLADYTLGANKGGEVSFFDDFDIDYNQFKYLYETRLSGALTKPKSAVIFKRAASGTTTTTTTESDEVGDGGDGGEGGEGGGE